VTKYGVEASFGIPDFTNLSFVKIRPLAFIEVCILTLKPEFLLFANEES
jgi:hypothetical protein